MFGPKSQERATLLLANYGATHFMLSPEGVLHAVCGQNFVPIVEALDVQIGPTVPEIEAAAIEKAQRLNQPG